MPVSAGITSLRAVLAGLSGGSANTHLLGTGRSPSLDISAVIEFRSKYPIYLNVGNWIDTYLVNNIEGVDDTEVRYASEANPGDHGETPFDSWYAGRTVVLNGKLISRRRDKLDDMATGLQAAFLDLQNEFPLIFHAANPDNSVYVMCKKSAKMNIPKAQAHLNEFQRTFNITLKATNPRFLSLRGEFYATSGDIVNADDFSGAVVPVAEDFMIVGPDGVTSGYQIYGDGWVPNGSGLLVRNTAAKAAKNLLADPRFEHDPVTYWWKLNSSKLSVEVDSSGDRLLQIANTGANAPFGTSQYTQIPFFDSGAKRSAIVWVRSLSGPRMISIEMDFTDNLGNVMDYQYSPNVIVGNSWTPIKLEGLTVPDGANLLSFFVLSMNPNVGDKFEIKSPRVSDSSTIDEYLDERSLWGEDDGDGSMVAPYKTYVSARKFANSSQIVKFTTGTAAGPNGDYDGLRLIISYRDDDNMLWGEVMSNYRVDNSSMAGYIALKRRVNGVEEIVSYYNWMPWAFSGTKGQYVPLSRGRDYWLQTFMIDGYASVALFASDPSDPALSESPILSIDSNNADLSLFTEALPLALSLQDHQAGWKIDLWKYEELPSLPGWRTVTGIPALTKKNNQIVPVPGANATVVEKLDIPYKVADQAVTMEHGYRSPLRSNHVHAVGAFGKMVLSNTGSPEFIGAWIRLDNNAGGFGQMQLRRYYGGSFETLATVTIDNPLTLIGQKMWLRLVASGNVMSAQHWTSDPALGGAPTKTASATLTGANALKHGAGIRGDIGFFTDMFDSALSPYIDNFKFDQSVFDGLVFSPVNNGNFEAQTTMELTGPMTNPRILNERNGTASYISTSIPAGETWVLENVGSSKRLYRKSDGVSRMRYFDDTSGWVLLDPAGDPNPIRFTATGLAAGWAISMRYQHTYM